MIHRLDHYKPEHLQPILQRAAVKLKTELDEASALAIGQRARGTPRIALQLLKRVRDLAQVRYQSVISPETVNETLEMLAIDHKGLTEHDRRFLTLIIDKYKGGPVGLSTLAAAFNEDPVTIEEVLEPFLIQSGFIQKTPKGRVVTDSSKLHLSGN